MTSPHRSDRLVDALFAWGTPEKIGERLQAHLDAGADHVAVQRRVGRARRERSLEEMRQNFRDLRRFWRHSAAETRSSAEARKDEMILFVQQRVIA